jgi:hypothetical protein
MDSREPAAFLRDVIYSPAMRSLTSAALLTLTLTLTACGGSDEESEAPTVGDAVDGCDSGTGETKPVQLTSDGGSLTMNADTFGVEGQIKALGVVGCVVDKLDGPASIAERVGSTTGMSGPQSEDWDGFEANWVYSGASNTLLFTVDAD